jgi:hypothetical protein
MKLPWFVEPKEVAALRGDSGTRFVKLMNALLAAEASIAGLALDAVLTSERSNEADGGVDAAIGGPLARPFPGVQEPTVWQYKAVEAKSIRPAAMRRELAKPGVAARMARGHQYVLCVCDDLTPPRFEALNATLTAHARELYPNAPAPRLLGASQIAIWLHSHPAAVVAHFPRSLEGGMPYEAWRRTVAAELPKFVKLPSREDVTARIRHHAQGGELVPPVLTVAAPSGGGASRLVAEALSEVAGEVIACMDPNRAPEIVTSILSVPTAHAVVVVDRCSLAARKTLERATRGAPSRLRVVAIHDPVEETGDAIAVPPLVEDETRQIIEANFADIRWDDRHAIVHLAGGTVQVAAFLATAYGRGPAVVLRDGERWAVDELRDRVRDPADLRALKALSTFSRVGVAGSIASQAAEVETLFRLERGELLVRVRRLARLGIARLGERYLSLRPRLFARSLFANAWEDVIGQDLDSVLSALSQPLQNALFDQAASCADEHVRDALASRLADKLQKVAPAALFDESTMRDVARLVPIHPVRAVRILDGLVGRLADDQARPSSGQALVRALEDLVVRSATHSLAERALFRLACVEEAPIGRRREEPQEATAAWADSYAISNSGTEVPFLARIQLLEEKLDRHGESAVPWIVLAVRQALRPRGRGFSVRPLRDGQLPVEEWIVRSRDERNQCEDAALKLLQRCFASSEHRPLVWEVITSCLRGLVSHGHCAVLIRLGAAYGPSDAERAELRGEVELFLAYEGKRDSARTNEPYAAEYLDVVQRWADELAPTTLLARLHEALGSSSLHKRYDDEAAWRTSLDELSKELLRSEAHFDPFLPLLLSGESTGVADYELGECLGRNDEQANLLERLVRNTQLSKPLVTRGYLAALAVKGPSHHARVLALFDELERDQPRLALDLARAYPAAEEASRALRLVREGRLAPEHLLEVTAIRWLQQRTVEAIEAVTDRLAEDPEKLAEVGLGLLHASLHGDPSALPSDERGNRALWRVLESGARSGEPLQDWGLLLRFMANRDRAPAVRLACDAVAHAGYSVSEEALSALCSFAQEASRDVMDAVGPLLLDLDNYRVSRSDRRALVHALSDEDVRKWVGVNGLPAARAIAAYLPSPFLDNGQPRLPPLTEYMLREFGADPDVATAFANVSFLDGVRAGDIAGSFDRDAAFARHFLTHPIPAVQAWAENVEADARQQATWWREHQEEAFDR